MCMFMHTSSYRGSEGLLTWHVVLCDSDQVKDHHVTHSVEGLLHQEVEKVVGIAVVEGARCICLNLKDRRDTWVGRREAE